MGCARKLRGSRAWGKSRPMDGGCCTGGDRWSSPQRKSRARHGEGYAGVVEERILPSCYVSVGVTAVLRDLGWSCDSYRRDDA